MTVLRCSIDDPRLDWGVSRTCYGGDPAQPANYTAYLILWDAKQHGADWFRENGEEVVGIIVSTYGYPAHADAFVIHEVTFGHHEACPEPIPLTDGEVIRLACQRLNSPINFAEGVSEWRSVQEEVFIDMGISVFYNALFLTSQGDRYLLNLVNMWRGEHEAFDSAEKITLADCRVDDGRADVSVPQREFRAEYDRALGRRLVP